MAGQNSPYIVVAIDGPAGSGKSTVAYKLARRLAFVHLNSGALFRAVGLEAEARGITIRDPGSFSTEASSADRESYEEKIASLARSLRFEFILGPSGETKFLVDGCDKCGQVFSQKAGELASKIAVLGKLRQVLLEVQHLVAAQSNVVVEGRDAGTVVFPGAAAKYFLEAGLEVRAKRRFDQIAAAKSAPIPDSGAVLSRIQQELQQRDSRDLTREIAPGIAADDAQMIDTGALDADQVVAAIMADLDRRGLVAQQCCGGR